MSFSWADGASGTLTIRGIKLEVASWGPDPKQAPTLVLLHEGLGCIMQWREFPEKLTQATGFGVFAYSRAGYGASDPVLLPRPLDYLTREAVEVLPALLDAIHLKSGMLIGHSDGASIAAIYAAVFSDHRVRGITLMAPHFFTEAMGLAQIASARKDYQTTNLRDKLARYHQNVDVAFLGWNETWLDPEFKAWNIAASIDEWDIPVLVIQGEQDQFGTIAQVEEVLRRAHTEVDALILPECRHAPHFDQPSLTLKTIANFAQSTLTSGRRAETPI